MRRGDKLVLGVAVALMSGAAIQELLKPADERTWHGRFFGIPYDYRRPSLERVKQSWWNPDDERILTPRSIGMGWDINLFQVRRQVELALHS